MRQFGVHANPSVRSREIIPYVVVLQSHLLSGMPTVVVAPMLVADGRPAYSQISAVVDFGGGSCIVSVGELAALDHRRLGEALGDLLTYEDQIRRALERLFTGF